jgi:hypothetical protein
MIENLTTRFVQQYLRGAWVGGEALALNAS